MAQHPLLSHTANRPWPVPEKPWRWAQTWSHLLFAHWRVPAETLRPLIPAGLAVQEFDGSAWIGVIPFLLDVRPRFVPLLPRVFRFPEINVRTYVEADGKPGVWFFSLDAKNLLAVWAARKFFHLPYYKAQMQIELDGGDVRYATRRTNGASRRSSSLPTAPPQMFSRLRLAHLTTGSPNATVSTRRIRRALSTAPTSTIRRGLFRERRPKSKPTPCWIRSESRGPTNRRCSTLPGSSTSSFGPSNALRCRNEGCVTQILTRRTAGISHTLSLQ